MENQVGSKYLLLFKYIWHLQIGTEGYQDAKVSGGNVIKMITELKLFNLNKRLRGSRVGIMLSFKYLKPFQMLYKKRSGT